MELTLLNYQIQKIDSKNWFYENLVLILLYFIRILKMYLSHIQSQYLEFI